MSAILCLYVNALDSALENTYLGAVATGFDHCGLFLDADDLADDTTDSGDLISNLQGVAHIIGRLLLLFLRSVHKEVEYSHHNDEHNDGGYTRAAR